MQEFPEIFKLFQGFHKGKTLRNTVLDKERQYLNIYQYRSTTSFSSLLPWHTGLLLIMLPSLLANILMESQ